MIRKLVIQMSSARQQPQHFRCLAYINWNWDLIRVTLRYFLSETVPGAVCKPRTGCLFDRAMTRVFHVETDHERLSTGGNCAPRRFTYIITFIYPTFPYLSSSLCRHYSPQTGSICYGYTNYQFKKISKLESSDRVRQRKLPSGIYLHFLQMFLTLKTNVEKLP